MKHTASDTDNLVRFWNPNRVSIFRLVFRILVCAYFVWAAIMVWSNPYRSILQQIFETALGIFGCVYGGSALNHIRTHQLSYLMMAMKGSLKSAQKDFATAEAISDTIYLGEEYLFCQYRKPVPYRSIRRLIYWDSTLFYRSKNNFRHKLCLSKVAPEDAKRYISLLESRIRDNPGFQSAEYVPEGVLLPGKRIRRILSYVIPQLWVERKITEHTAGVGTLALHLMNILCPVIGFIMIVPFFMMLKDLSQGLALSDPWGIAAMLFSLGLLWWGASLILKLPLLLLKKIRRGEMKGILQDFNESQRVFDRIYIGKKYLFRSGSMEILSLNTISHFLVGIRPDRHWAIYYQPTKPGSRPVLFHTGIRSGHHELVDMLNQYLPAQQKEKQAPIQEPLKRYLTTDKEELDALVEEILREEAEKQP